MTNPSPTYATVTLQGPLNLDGWTTAARPATPATGASGFNSTIGQVETWNGTAWVSGGGGGVSSVIGNTGSVTLAELVTGGVAPIASPTFTGAPAAPTPATADNSTALATTAYVTNKVAAATAGVSTVNGRSGAVTITGSDVTGAMTSTDAVEQTAWGALGSLGTLTNSSAPLFQISYSESFAMGSAFYDAVTIVGTRTGGTGHRQALTAQITSSGTNSGEFLCGVSGFTFITSGSGSAFGMNGFAQALSGAASSAQVSGAEFNTDVRTPVSLKTGVQIVDVNTSTQDGTTRSAGLYIAAQTGGVGWQSAIQFGDFTSPATTAPTSTDLILLAGTPGAVSLQRGIDFRAGNFSRPAIDLPLNASLAWEGGTSGNLGGGGTILSQTANSGPTVLFGTGSIQLRNAANNTTAFAVSTSDAASPQVNCNVPVVVGTPTGLAKAVGTLNAVALYNNGVLVVGPNSLNNPGYDTLPSGRIEQWATVTTSSGGTVTWNFPTPFPTRAVNIQATYAGSAPTTVAAAASIINTSSATVVLTNTTTGAGVAGIVSVRVTGN